MPVTAATANPADASVTVTGTLASASGTLQRYTPATGAWVTVGTVTDANWSFLDRFAPSTGQVSYQLIDGGSTSTPLVLQVSTGGWWLRDVALPSLTRKIVPSEGDPQFEWDRETGEYWPLGATVATVFLGATRLVKITLPALMLWGPNDRHMLQVLLDRGAIQLATDTGETYWVAASKLPKVTEPNGALRARGDRLLLATIELVPVGTPAGGS